MATYKHLTVKKHDDIVVVRFVDTKLFNNLVTHELDDELSDVADQTSARRWIVDFGPLERCSTSVINSLLRLNTRITDAGGQVKLCGLHEVIAGELQMLGLEGTVFEVHPTVAAAIGSFQTVPDRHRHFKLQMHRDVFVLHLLDMTLRRTLVVSELSDELEQLHDEEHPKKVLINFGGVRSCSTEVINALLRFRTRLLADDGQVRLCGVNDDIAREFEMLQLDDSVLPIFDSASRALASFSAR